MELQYFVAATEPHTFTTFNYYGDTITFALFYTADPASSMFWCEFIAIALYKSRFYILCWAWEMTIDW